MFSVKIHWPVCIVLGLCLLELSCNKSTRLIIPAAQIPVENTPIVLPEEHASEDTAGSGSSQSSFFQDWYIQKKSIGPVQIGMTIRQVDSLLYNFQKQTAVALDFGFGGGSPAYVYSMDSVPVIAIVQALNSKRVFALIAISDLLKTKNGLYPQMTVEQLLDVYPQMKFYQDYMNGWEYADDEFNQWSFIFITDDANQIGIYKQPDQPSSAKRTTAKNAWITVQ